MMKLKEADVEFSLDRYHILWDAAHKRFSAEASDLNLKVIPKRMRITNPKTGNTVTFELRNTVKDREGEITHWEYSILETMFGGITFTLWND